MQQEIPGPKSIPQSELLNPNDSSASQNGPPSPSPPLRLWHRLRSFGRFVKASGKCHGDIAGSAQEITQIEDYRPGYPQYSALIGSHPSFHIFRRFLRLRARLLLVKQDELALLESQLDQVDLQETKELFLGNRRRDTNPERKEILLKAEAALANYDAILGQNRAILACESPFKGDVVNLQNWVGNKTSLAQEETSYLFQSRDLMTTLSPRDDALGRLMPWIESFMSILCRLFKIPRLDISRDPNVTIFSDSVLHRLTRTFIASFVIVFLLLPIVIINALASIALRIVVIVVASVVLITALSNATNAKTVEVFVSGAT